MRNAASSVGPSAGAVVLGSSILGVLLAAGCGLLEPGPNAVFRQISYAGRPLPTTVDRGVTAEGDLLEVQAISATMYLFYRTKEFKIEATAHYVVSGAVRQVVTNVSRYGRFEYHGDTLKVLWQFPDLSIHERAFILRDRGHLLEETSRTAWPGTIYRKQ